MLTFSLAGFPAAFYECMARTFLRLRTWQHAQWAEESVLNEFTCTVVDATNKFAQEYRDERNAPGQRWFIANQRGEIHAFGHPTRLEGQTRAPVIYTKAVKSSQRAGGNQYAPDGVRRGVYAGKAASRKGYMGRESSYVASMRVGARITLMELDSALTYGLCVHRGSSGGRLRRDRSCSSGSLTGHQSGRAGPGTTPMGPTTGGSPVSRRASSH